MKTLVKTLSMIAICMAASLNLNSCSSSDDEEVMEEQKTFNVIGKWTTIVAQPLEDMTAEEAKLFATNFQVAILEFKADGTLIWHEYDKATGNPVPTQHKGTYSVTGNKITISAPDSHWMTGTHTIESINKYNDTLLMEWIVNTSLGKGRFVFTPAVVNI